ncbi:ABC transporter permease [Nonomuraea sp. NPDC000554]|uniref:ABC transporter permease n=1 Tax=Nonomuraea sp. NPDC000554 TaxID=3154259 RepID=UPI00332F95A4
MTGTLWALVRTEVTLLVRTPLALFAAVALPFAVLLLMVLFIGFSFPTLEFGAMPGVRVIDRLLPEMAGTVATAVGITLLTTHVADSRARGMLRWLRRTPMREGSYLAAQAIAAGVLVVASTALFTAATFAIYGLPRSWHPLNLVGATLIVTYCAFSTGLLLGGLRMPPAGARVAAPLCFALLFAGSGLGVPREGWAGVAPWFYEITNYNPLAQLNDFVFNAYLGRLSGTWPVVAGLLLTAVVVNLVTRRSFDWDGRP